MATQIKPAALKGLSGLARQLVIEGALTADDAREAARMCLDNREPLGPYLVKQGLAQSVAVAMANAREFGVPVFDINLLDQKQIPIDLVSEALVDKHKALPLFKRGNRLFVGVSDPSGFKALDEIGFHAGCAVEPVLVDAGDLERVIDQVRSNRSSDIAGLDGDDGLDSLDLEAGSDESGSEGADATGGKDDAPVVKFVNKMLVDAIRRGASDIHFEPYEGQYRVRYRMDGVLVKVANPPRQLAPRISSRLKVISNLDIAEKRVPQDGRTKLRLSKTTAIDFRVSTLPTLFGEKVVMRVLDSSAATMGIDKLGYEEDQKKLYLDAIHKPYGMVLVTGPTGSGKTVSLYTALNILNDSTRNISTVEDPVEIRVEGVNQVQQNQKRGMTFAAALRSFLRQDPDVIMVGEIRDLETAEIAIKAAQTGHMVLSTLHTNDAPKTIARLMNMGVAPFNITSAVSLVIAQRLARRLHECKKKLDLPAEALLQEGFPQAEVDAGLQIYGPGECNGCTKGYKGRVGVYEVMPMGDEIQRIILKGGNAMEIAEAARNEGVRDLHQSALLKVKNGVTDLTEINRVTTD